MQWVHEISPLLDGHFMGPGKANDTPSGLLHHQPAGWAHISPTCETNRWWNARILVMDAMQWRCAKSHGVAHQRQVENSVASLKSGKLRWNLLGSIWVIGDFVTKWKDTQRSKVDSFVKLNGSMVHWCLKFKHIWQHRSFSAKLQKVMKNWLRRATRLLCPHVAAIFRWGDDWVIFALKQLGISTKRKSNPWIYGCKRWSKGYNQQKLGANNDIISGTGGQNSVLPVVSSTVGTTIDLTWCTEEIPRDNSLSLLV